MGFSFFKPRRFNPDFPIIPLYATEDEALELLGRHGMVWEEEPENDRSSAQKLLVTENADTRIAVGIWDGRVRFVNYRTEQANADDKQKLRKLQWFVDYYGGSEEFDDPRNTGYMIFMKNRQRKLMLVLGLHMGPIRVNDLDPEHWPEEGER